MPYTPIEPGEEVPRPRVTEWRPTSLTPIACGLVVDAALTGLIVEVDGGLEGLVTTDVDCVLEWEITPNRGGAFRSLDDAQRSVDIASRVMDLY